LSNLRRTHIFVVHCLTMINVNQRGTCIHNIVARSLLLSVLRRPKYIIVAALVISIYYILNNTLISSFIMRRRVGTCIEFGMSNQRVLVT
jgi:hypothetical protein